MGIKPKINTAIKGFNKLSNIKLIAFVSILPTIKNIQKDAVSKILENTEKKATLTPVSSGFSLYLIMLFSPAFPKQREKNNKEIRETNKVGTLSAKTDMIMSKTDSFFPPGKIKYSIPIALIHPKKEQKSAIMLPLLTGNRFFILSF